MQTNYLNKSYHSKNKGSASNFMKSQQSSYIQLNTNKQMELLTARCPVHPQQILTNYCTSDGCRLPLCPDCIEDHIHDHKQSRQIPDICSIKQARFQGIQKLNKLIDFISKDLDSLQPPKSIDKIVTQTNHQLRRIKQMVQRTIEQYFASLQNHLVQRVRQSEAVLKKIEKTHETMEKMLAQLRNLAQILRINDQSTPGTIKKVFDINQTALLDSFANQLRGYAQERERIEIRVDFDERKFKQNINQTIKVSFKASSGGGEVSYSKNLGLQLADLVRYKKNPSLHFFEAGSSNLHLIDLPSMNRRHITLNSNFIVPHFHNSILSSNNQIWLTGGKFDDTQRKNTSVSKYSLIKGTFQPKVSQVIQRSSHSSIEHNGYIYLIGGYGSQDTEGGLLQIQKINIESGKTNIESSSKYGGSCILGIQNDNILIICVDGIEIFNTRRKVCSQVYVPNFIWYQSCAGVSINQSEILIFGGYEVKHQNDPGSPINSSLVLDITDLNEVRVKDKNQYNLPIGGGFRSCAPIIFARNLYALQNIQEKEGQDLSTNCLDGDRTLLRFDGKSWQDISI